MVEEVRVGDPNVFCHRHLIGPLRMVLIRVLMPQPGKMLITPLYPTPVRFRVLLGSSATGLKEFVEPYSIYTYNQALRIRHSRLCGMHGPRSEALSDILLMLR